jgi:hypothetical protein
MVASISSSTVNNWSESLFNKLDTKKQGYVDQADLAAALGTDEAGSTANSDAAADMVKQFDGDSDGKITQSELSAAVSKVADELNAQFDSSRVDKSQAVGATGVASMDEAADNEDGTSVSATGAATTASAARGAPPASGGAAPVAASSTESDNKYVQAADTDTDGTVSDAEAAAYKKLMAAQAEGTSGSKVDGADSDKDLARALDQLKQYVENSSDGAVPGTSTVDVNA